MYLPRTPRLSGKYLSHGEAIGVLLPTGPLKEHSMRTEWK